MLTRVGGEVRLPNFLPRLVAPKSEWLRGVRPGAYKLARDALALDILAVEIEYLDLHTERLALDLCSVGMSRAGHEAQ